MSIDFDRWAWIISHRAGGVAGGFAKALALSALKVGTDMHDGEMFGIRQSEEAFTSSVLLDLARQEPRLRVRTLSRSEETVEGADWEWWIQGARHWFGFLVQAKRVHEFGSGDIGYELGYIPSASNSNPSPKRQIDSLLLSSEILQIPAIYALYNEAGKGRRYSDPLRGACFVPDGADGVTVLSAEVANWLLSLRTKHKREVSVKEVAPFTFPWSCLAYCVNSTHAVWPSVPDHIGIPEWYKNARTHDSAFQAARLVRSLRMANLSNQYAAAVVERSLTGTDGVSFAIRKEPPPYVPRVRAESDDSDDSAGPHLDEGSFEHPLLGTGMMPRFVASLGAKEHDSTDFSD